MSEQAGQNVMAILPDALRDNERRVGIKAAENFHAHLLRIDEAMALRFVEGMRAHHAPAFGFKRSRDDGLHLHLFRPALLVGGRAEVAAGHEVNVTRFEPYRCLHECRAGRLA